MLAMGRGIIVDGGKHAEDWKDIAEGELDDRLLSVCPKCGV
jgi:hypothetical protein